MASVEAIEKLYAANRDRAHIYVVYIREAHPTDGRAIPTNRYKITDPKPLEERQKVAREFARDLKLSMPVLVDTLDDQVNKAYAGWPDRIYVVDGEGKIALKGDVGPRGFSPAVRATPGVLESVLKK